MREKYQNFQNWENWEVFLKILQMDILEKATCKFFFCSFGGKKINKNFNISLVIKYQKFLDPFYKQSIIKIFKKYIIVKIILPL